VDPVVVAHVAGQSLTAAQELADAWSTAQRSLTVAAESFGDSPGGQGVQVSYQATSEDADVPFGRFVAVLEGDTDRLYGVAFAFQKVDEDAARRLRQHPPGQ
jgi:hypothetical protein